MKRLFLVRHGESEWNCERRLQGQADIALTPRGREQARQLRPVIAALAPDRVLTSDLQRARDTARLLGCESPELCASLREIDVGDWTGAAIAQLEQMDLNAYRDWRAGLFTPPRGEGWGSFKKRVSAVAADCLAEGAKRALLVAHGGVIRAVLESLLDLRPDRIVPVGPASLTILKHVVVNGRPEFRLELFNFLPTGPLFDAPD